MKKWQKFLLVFLLIIGIGGGVAYLESLSGGGSKSLFAEDCIAHCRPRKGVIERIGSNAGPDWRPTSHNVVCTCK